MNNYIEYLDIILSELNIKEVEIPTNYICDGEKLIFAYNHIDRFYFKLGTERISDVTNQSLLDKGVGKAILDKFFVKS